MLSQKGIGNCISDGIAPVIGCTPIRLEDEHLAELQSLIAQLPSAVQDLSSAEEKNLERFEKLVQLYSEEPQLLDVALASLVDGLLKFVEFLSPPPNSAIDGVLPPLTSAALIRLRILSIIRGHKFLMHFLPHQFELLEPVLQCLENFATILLAASPNASVPIDKRIVHILTTWLSIICKNPFNLSRIRQNGNSQTTHSQEGNFERRIAICLDILMRKMATIGELAVIPTLLAQILTRNVDNEFVLAPRFDEFVHTFRSFESELDGGIPLISQLKLLIALLKQGRRVELRPFVLSLLHSLPPQFVRANCPNILVRQLVAKLLHRLALVLLRPRLAPWRYRCGHRSLEENLLGRRNQNENEARKGDEENDEESEGETAEERADEAAEHFEEIENLLAELLLKITDKDNTVRWTASKGVARICSRLPLKMGAEVVSSVLTKCFSDSAADEANAWHGGCLALAELCRRGCLLPCQVPKVIVDLLPRALTFEQFQLGFMQAVNVRDAACYICWAFARAYEAQLLRDHLPSLAGVLLSVALFDREVNVRRAASAAFQENVGRNDSFPHGIAVLTLVDFVEVARIKHCYTDLAVQVGFSFFPADLFIFRIHWDEMVRKLAADAIQRIASFDLDYAYEKIFPVFCARLRSSDSVVKHGAFLGVSALLFALNGTHDVLKFRAVFFSAISDQRLSLADHRSKGFSLVGKSLCRLIAALCSIGCDLTDEQLLQFHDILDVVISDSNKQMAEYAAAAFPALMAFYKNGRFAFLINRIQHKYFAEIVGPCRDEFLRVSCIVPLGHIPADFLSSHFDGTSLLGASILQKLKDAVTDVRTPKWVFVRVAAIQTVGTLLTKFTPPNFDWGQLMECLASVSDDYTTTTNGDIGRFVRLEAIAAIGRLLPLAFSSALNSLTISQCQLNKAIGKVVERACEAIDGLREKACSVLGELMQLEEKHPLSEAIAERDLLSSLFTLGKCQNGTTPGATTTHSPAPFEAADWRFSQGFARLAPLLNSNTYGRNALAGFVLSAGSVCSWTSQNAFLAIVSHLKPNKRNAKFLDSFLSDLLSVHSSIVSRQGDPGPVLQLFRLLLNDRQLQEIEENPDGHFEFTALCELPIKLSVGKGRPKVKTLAVSVLGSLLQLNKQSQMYRRVLRLLISLLDSPYASLREQAAEQLFEFFSCESDDSEHGTEMALKLLTETDWGRGREGLGENRRRISAILLANAR
ncbi:hypothetical protein niasHS_017681 [Heterodera schachtii]|uniref:Tubulin-specific chaperone D n=1 Tax=Heterodera schachtii TaxID=97005 RepID=A0ABD2I486_HETSC